MRKFFRIPHKKFSPFTTLYQFAAFVVLFLFFLNLPGSTVYSLSVQKKLPSLIRPLPIAPPQLSTYPFQISEVPVASVSARSVLVTDFDTGAVLYRKNAGLERPPASLIKLLTAVVALGHCTTNQVLQVPANFSLPSDDSRMGLVPNEKMTVENLLYGLLLPSGDDAADVLAQGCSSPNKTFVQLLNEKAVELGLRQTNITNPSGEDEAGNVTSAEDLEKITRLFLQNPLLASIVRTPYRQVTDTSGVLKHQLFNTNVLLGSGNVYGVKTGTTDDAGQNFIGLFTVASGHKILLIELGSSDRFTEAEMIVNWVNRTFVWHYPAPLFNPANATFSY